MANKISVHLPADEIEVLSDILSDGIPGNEDASVVDALNDAETEESYVPVTVSLGEKEIQALFYYISRHNHLYSPIEGELADWYHYCDTGK